MIVKTSCGTDGALHSTREEREADVMSVVVVQITVSSHLSCAGKSWRGTWQVWHEADIIIIIVPSLCF